MCRSEQAEKLADAVEQSERQLALAEDRRERVTGWWVDKPASLHRKLVLEGLDQRVAGCKIGVARSQLAEADR